MQAVALKNINIKNQLYAIFIDISILIFDMVEIFNLSHELIPEN